MKYLKKFDTNSSFLSFKESSDFILPNVSLIKDIDNVSFNPFVKEIVPTIYATYDTSLLTKLTDIIGDDYNGNPLFCLGNTSNVKTLTINDKKVDFTPPTKVTGTIEILASQVNVQTGEFPLNLGLQSKTHKISLQPKNLNDNYDGVGLVYYVDGTYHIEVIHEMYFSMYGLTYDDISNFVDMFTLEANDVILNAVLLQNTMTDNPIIIDTVVTYTYYEGGLQPQYVFDSHGVYNVKIELMDEKIPAQMFTNIDIIEGGATAALTDNIKLENIKNIGLYGLYIICNELDLGVLENTAMYNMYIFLGKRLELPATLKSPVMTFLMTPLLEEVVIPDNFNMSGEFLYEVPNLSSITCYATIAPELDSSFNTVAPTGTLYYPAGSDYSSWLERLGEGWTGVEI